MEIKQQLYRYCREYATNRIARLRQQLTDLRESLDSETKNSTGDKHETGRAMIQLEQEQVANALREAERLGQDADRMPKPSPASGPVAPGSLVRCGPFWYYFGIGAGAVTLEGQQYFCISPASPAGLQLLGKSIGDTVVLPAGTYRIEAHV